MTTPEARRLDLYNGFAEVFGQERADTLMTYLSAAEADQLATKADVGHLGQRIDQLTSTISELSRRVDRVLFALIAGLVAIVATLISQL